MQIEQKRLVGALVRLMRAPIEEEPPGNAGSILAPRHVNDDWWTHVFNERRSAIAHAVRDPDRPEDLDPDGPDMQGRFGLDAPLLDDLVHMRVQERWGQHAVMRLRRRDILDGPTQPPGQVDHEATE
jgi:hypothetical protein